MIILIYYGLDGEAAKAKAAELRRAKHTSAQLRDARAFNGEVEPCDKVILMPDVSAEHAARLRTGYDKKIEAPPQTDITALRAEYLRVVGKKPFPGWKAATLNAKIAEAQHGA